MHDLYGTLDLEVRKALHLRQAEQVCRQILEPVEALHLRICPDDVIELAQEPFVDFRQFVDAVLPPRFLMSSTFARTTSIVRIPVARVSITIA